MGMYPNNINEMSLLGYELGVSVQIFGGLQTVNSLYLAILRLGCFLGMVSSRDPQIEGDFCELK